MSREMAPADSCCNSPPSPSPLSTSTPQWVASPSRTRDSAPRPRRSLLSSHFSASLQADDAKVQQLPMAERPSPVSVDVLSKSLPSPPISAFLDQEEEEALEPSTPPHVGTSHVPPMAPRKSFRYRVAPCGKHKPRRLLFEEEEEPSAPADATGGSSSSQPAINDIHGSAPAEAASFSQPAINSIHGGITPPHQSFNSFVPAKRIHMRDLR